MLRQTEGNPLFVEQLHAMGSEDPWWHRKQIPATIQSLLAARLDRIGPGERCSSEFEAAGSISVRRVRWSTKPWLQFQGLPTWVRTGFGTRLRHICWRVVRTFVPTAGRGASGSIALITLVYEF